MYSHVHRSCLSLCCWQGAEALQHGCHEILAKPPCQPGASLGQLCQLILSPCKMISLLIWGCYDAHVYLQMSAIFGKYYITIWYQYDTHTCIFILFYVFNWTVQCQLGMEVLEKCLEVSAFGVKAASLSQDSATSCACHGMSSDIMSCPNKRQHEMIAQYVLRSPVSLSFSASAFAVLNIRSEACTKFNCTQISKLMCIPCTVQSYAVFDFFATNPITIDWNKS